MARGTAMLVVVAAALSAPAVACGSSRDAAAVLSAPRLTGVPRIAARVHVSAGTWSGRPSRLRFRWERCVAPGIACSPIAGASSATYTVSVKDLGSRLQAVVRATVDGVAATARSRPSARVTVRPMASPCSGVQVVPGVDVAALVAASGAGATFCFRPGRYPIRHTISPQKGDRFIGQPGTVLDAGITIRGWRHVGSVWEARAPRTTPTFSYGGGYNGSYKYPQAVYADDVFESNAPLLKAGVEYGGRVIGGGIRTLRAGRYFYDYDHGRIVLGANPAGHRVELEGLPDGVIHSYQPDVTVEGLTVQGSLGDGIVTGSGANWVVEGNEVRLNHSEGVRVTNGGRVLRNYIHDNGTYGIAATGDNMLFEGNEVARNNTSRYYFGDGQCSDAGGSKITLSRNVTLERNWYHRNHCIGIWFDIGDYGVTIAHNHVDRNYENGIDYEISYNAVIAGNEVSGSSRWGILDSASPNVTIASNWVSGNRDGSVVLNQGPRTDSPSAYGPHEVRNVRVTGNRIVMGSGRAGGLQEDVAGTPFAGVVFSATNRFDHNRYILGNLADRWFEWANGPVTIAQWRAAGQDAGSTFRAR